MNQSISQLSELTGKTRETIAKRLKAAGLEPTPGPANSKVFDSVAALPAIYDAPVSDQGALMAAKVKNLEADTELKSIRRRRETGDLIPALVVERVWSGMTGNARAKLLNLHYSLAANCIGGTFEMIQARATEIIYQCLDELHNYRVEDYLTEPLLPDENAD